MNLRLVKVPRCGIKWPSGRAAVRGRRLNLKITRRLHDKTRRYIEVR